jgi:putative redox protein
MPEMTVTVAQLDGTATSAGSARDHRVLIDRPRDKGGLDQGPMGGELLLLALGGCFMSNLIAAASSRAVSVEGLAVTVRASVASAPPRFDAITLEVHGKAADDGALDRLVTIAERACIVHNTLAAGTRLTIRRA